MLISVHIPYVEQCQDLVNKILTTAAKSSHFHPVRESHAVNQTAVRLQRLISLAIDLHTPMTLVASMNEAMADVGVALADLQALRKIFELSEDPNDLPLGPMQKILYRLKNDFRIACLRVHEFYDDKEMPHVLPTQIVLPHTVGKIAKSSKRMFSVTFENGASFTVSGIILELLNLGYQPKRSFILALLYGGKVTVDSIKNSPQNLSGDFSEEIAKQYIAEVKEACHSSSGSEWMSDVLADRTTLLQSAVLNELALHPDTETVGFVSFDVGGFDVECLRPNITSALAVRAVIPLRIGRIFLADTDVTKLVYERAWQLFGSFHDNDIIDHEPVECILNQAEILREKYPEIIQQLCAIETEALDMRKFYCHLLGESSVSEQLGLIDPEDTQALYMHLICLCLKRLSAAKQVAVLPISLPGESMCFSYPPQVSEEIPELNERVKETLKRSPSCVGVKARVTRKAVFFTLPFQADPFQVEAALGLACVSISPERHQKKISLSFKTQKQLFHAVNWLQKNYIVEPDELSVEGDSVYLGKISLFDLFYQMQRFTKQNRQSESTSYKPRPRPNEFISSEVAASVLERHLESYFSRLFPALFLGRIKVREMGAGKPFLIEVNTLGLLHTQHEANSQDQQIKCMVQEALVYMKESLAYYGIKLLLAPAQVEKLLGTDLYAIKAETSCFILLAPPHARRLLAFFPVGEATQIARRHLQYIMLPLQEINYFFHFLQGTPLPPLNDAVWLPQITIYQSLQRRFLPELTMAIAEQDTVNYQKLMMACGFDARAVLIKYAEKHQVTEFLYLWHQHPTLGETLLSVRVHMVQMLLNLFQERLMNFAEVSQRSDVWDSEVKPLLAFIRSHPNGWTRVWSKEYARLQVDIKALEAQAHNPSKCVMLEAAREKILELLKELHTYTLSKPLSSNSSSLLSPHVMYTSSPKRLDQDASIASTQSLSSASSGSPPLSPASFS